MLVRFFRSGDGVALTSGDLRLRDDLEYLRIQWAISNQIEDLVRHLLENRHEAQASLETVLREGTAYIRGRLDPVRTLRKQRLTGNASLMCFHEPRRSFSEGPNHVLGWVLRFSNHILQRYLQLLSGSTEYNERVHRILRYLGSVSQLKGIGDAISNTSIRPRPSVASVTQAGKSRKRLYRKAFAAYQVLQRIESGDQQETVGLLNGSLIGPLEDWQKFELLLALKLSETLARETGHELVLRPIEQGSARPIATFGPYDVYWQNRTPYQNFPELEPSEVIVNDILRSYGIKVGSDRPDVVICDRVRKVVIAVAEAKYSTSILSWADAFRDAIVQLVRYSRLYNDCVPQDVLLRRSLVAVSNLPNEISNAPTPGTSPIAVGLENLIDGNLGPWTQRVISSALASTV